MTVVFMGSEFELGDKGDRELKQGFNVDAHVFPE